MERTGCSATGCWNSLLLFVGFGEAFLGGGLTCLIMAVSAGGLAGNILETIFWLTGAIIGLFLLIRGTKRQSFGHSVAGVVVLTLWLIFMFCAVIPVAYLNYAKYQY